MGDVELVAGVLDVVQVKRGNGGVADDGDAVGKVGAQVVGGVLQKACTDVDGVAVAGGVDV